MAKKKATMAIYKEPFFSFGCKACWLTLIMAMFFVVPGIIFSYIPAIGVGVIIFFLTYLINHEMAHMMGL